MSHKPQPAVPAVQEQGSRSSNQYFCCGYIFGRVRARMNDAAESAHIIRVKTTMYWNKSVEIGKSSLSSAIGQRTVTVKGIERILRGSQNVARRHRQEDEREGDRAHGMVVLQVRLWSKLNEMITQLYTLILISDGASLWQEIPLRSYSHAC